MSPPPWVKTKIFPPSLFIHSPLQYTWWTFPYLQKIERAHQPKGFSINVMSFIQSDTNNVNSWVSWGRYKIPDLLNCLRQSKWITRSNSVSHALHKINLILQGMQETKKVCLYFARPLENQTLFLFNEDETVCESSRSLKQASCGEDS